jgi:hypothetical protein
MYRSASYANEKGSTVLIDMAEASAETARLLRDARGAASASAEADALLARRIVDHGGVLVLTAVQDPVILQSCEGGTV